MKYINRNWIALGVSIIVAGRVYSLAHSLYRGTFWGDMLIGETSSAVFPFSLQNLMHVLFFIGLGASSGSLALTYEENVFLTKSGFLLSRG